MPSTGGPLLPSAEELELAFEEIGVVGAGAGATCLGGGSDGWFAEDDREFSRPYRPYVFDFRPACIRSPWWRLVDEDVWFHHWVAGATGPVHAHHRADPWFLTFCVFVLFVSLVLVTGSFPAGRVRGAWVSVVISGSHRDAPQARWVFVGIDELDEELRRHVASLSLRRPRAIGLPARLTDFALVWDPRAPRRLVVSRFVPWRTGVCLKVGGVLVILGTGAESEEHVRGSAARFELLRAKKIPSSTVWIAARSVLAILGITFAALATPFHLADWDLIFGERSAFALTALSTCVVLALLIRAFRQRPSKRSQIPGGTTDA